MLSLKQALGFFNKVMSSCENQIHIECMKLMRDNIIKLFNIDNTNIAVHCMDQSIELHEQYLAAKKPILKLSADEEVQYWIESKNLK